MLFSREMAEPEFRAILIETAQRWLTRVNWSTSRQRRIALDLPFSMRQKCAGLLILGGKRREDRTHAIKVRDGTLSVEA